MQLVEQHIIRKGDPRFAAIDQAAFASKNLYNAANYLVRQAFIENPAAFTAHPKLPKYKHKTQGRNLLTYTLQAISRKALKRGLIRLSGLALEVPTRQSLPRQVRIVPHKTHYTVEVIYEQSPK